MENDSGKLVLACNSCGEPIEISPCVGGKGRYCDFYGPSGAYLQVFETIGHEIAFLAAYCGPCNERLKLQSGQCR